ncbi:MAG: TRAP transporter small permease [Sulfitobacter sp.]
MKETSQVPLFVQRMDRFLDLLANTCRLMTGFALVFLTVIGGWLVFGRYVLNATPTWVEQCSLLLVMLIAFLGAAVGVHDHTHLSVVMLRTAVPRVVRQMLVVATDVVMAGFGGFMFWYGFQLTVFKWASPIPLLQLPEGLRSLPLTVGGALIFFFSVGHLIRLAMGVDERRDNIE